jgi:hypothetical protein
MEPVTLTLLKLSANPMKDQFQEKLKVLVQTHENRKHQPFVVLWPQQRGQRAEARVACACFAAQGVDGRLVRECIFFIQEEIWIAGSLEDAPSMPAVYRHCRG